MELEPALVQELSVISGLSAKIYPLNAPSKTVAPYLIYTSSFGLQDKSLDGYLRTKAVPMELNLIAPDYESMKQLQSAIITKLISFQSRVIGTDGPFIQEITYEEPDEIYEAAVKLHRSNIILKIHI